MLSEFFSYNFTIALTLLRRMLIILLTCWDQLGKVRENLASSKLYKKVIFSIYLWEYIL